MAAKKRLYLPIRYDRIFLKDPHPIVRTSRCPKCSIAVVEASSGQMLDSRFIGSDNWGNVTAAVHECSTSKKQRKPKRNDLWD